MATDHLGGFIPGGDPATYYPGLWAWLATTLKVERVLDVGSGEGFAVDFFASIGVDALGIEGADIHHDKTLRHDFTQGRLLLPEHLERFYESDLVWSCEFVEHVEELYVNNFLDTFAMAPIVAMTHAAPGQPGYHHVNCRDAAYWIEKMRGINFRLDPELTEDARLLAAANENPWNHFVRSGMIFRRQA